ncbi:Oidioi.mRNA.OKI2018_I69.XSR.g15555.t1.cds [Oikopleura dioica]|uniref:Oidioi.mRNA.OKI2018_I69.XSR.g15555.t1.cds n=1 Tax=Oikopleura dioica TaxID=34765 RepID=A0ABN7SHF2_OIKDI|nr:Oidioi.mRNA.OKI2018_I69.XSR.g15555.t1.cds [Oikopleura dioica]
MEGESMSLLSFGSHKERNYGTVSQRAYLGSAMGKAKEVDLVDYAVSEGETITGVAIKFSTSVEVLKSHNRFLCYDPELTSGKKAIQSTGAADNSATKSRKDASVKEEVRDKSLSDFFASIDSNISSGRKRLTNFNEDLINRLEE